MIAQRKKQNFASFKTPRPDLISINIYLSMSYKTARVSKALLVMVAFLLPVHIFLIKLTVSALFILEIYIRQKTWILYAKIQANRSINKPSMIFFQCACAKNIFL